MRREVMNVEKDLRKNEPERPGSLARKMLEVLGVTRAYVQSIGTQEEDVVRVNIPLDYSDWKPIEAALLEAEHQKAKAITQIRRHQII
ncbi:MAG: hypothetical protein JSW53_06205 [Candidatus Bathyarchaeota archaeon]|nr:MAG: hypothetical protein JSW53_06205 [Candidatus Bathyarchaeota archaeon]